MESGKGAGAILIGIGANLPSPELGAPVEACAAAVRALGQAGLDIVRQSPWYESAPVPVSDQPWYVNGVVRVATELPPQAVMDLLLETERRFGRIRGKRNAARVLDLDLIAHGGVVQGRDGGAGGGPILPHPRLAERAFVLLPLADILPGWRHPVTGLGVKEMIAGLPAGQEIRKLPEN